MCYCDFRVIAAALWLPEKTTGGGRRLESFLSAPTRVLAIRKALPELPATWDGFLQPLAFSLDLDGCFHVNNFKYLFNNLMCSP